MSDVWHALSNKIEDMDPPCLIYSSHTWFSSSGIGMYEIYSHLKPSVLIPRQQRNVTSFGSLCCLAVLPNCSKHHLRHTETHWKKSFKHQDYEAASSDFGLCMRKTVNYISIDRSVNQSAYITRFVVLILFSPLTTPKEKPANEFLICNTSVSAGSIKFKVLQENIA